MPKQKDGLYKIMNAEVFAAGFVAQLGRTFTEADIDDAIKTVKELGHLPPIKDGHHKEMDVLRDDKESPEGFPALGYVANLKRKGKVLLADFIDMPEVVYDAIRLHRYDRVSIEFAFQLVDATRKKHKIFLRAVSILGAEIPAIKELKPLRYANFDDDCESYEIDCTIKLAEWDAAFVNDLPDVAFAIIQSGGKKDEDNKTIPRTLRKLPHHNKTVSDPDDNKSVDLLHLRNALSRLPQTGITKEEQAKARAHLQKHMFAIRRENMSDDSLYHLASNGCAFILGELKSGKDGIASVVFAKAFWAVPGAKRWLSDRGMSVIGPVVMNKKLNTFTISVCNESAFVKDSKWKVVEFKEATLNDDDSDYYKRKGESKMTEDEVKKLFDNKLKQHTEKKDAEIKVLADKLALYEKEKGDETKVLADELAKVKKEKDAMVARLSDFEDKPEGSAFLKIQNRVDVLSTELNDKEKAISDLTAKHAALAEEKRLDRCKEKASHVNIPYLVPHFEALYDSASRLAATDVVMFSDNKEAAPSETSIEAVLDKTVKWVNKLADNKLFQQTANQPEFTLGDHTPADDPGVELDNRIQRLAKEKDKDRVKDYAELQEIVLSEDPALAELYLASI